MRKNGISNFEYVLVSVMTSSSEREDLVRLSMPEDAEGLMGAPSSASHFSERKATLGTPTAKAEESAKKTHQRRPMIKRPTVFAEDEEVVRERFQGGEWKALDLRHMAGAMLDLDVPAPAATTKMGVDGRFAVPGKAAVCSTLEKSKCQY